MTGANTCTRVPDWGEHALVDSPRFNDYRHAATGAEGTVRTLHHVNPEGMLLDVWTLNAGTPDWEQHLAGALALGADIVTSNTPRALARAPVTD